MRKNTLNILHIHTTPRTPLPPYSIPYIYFSESGGFYFNLSPDVHEPRHSPHTDVEIDLRLNDEVTLSQRLQEPQTTKIYKTIYTTRNEPTKHPITNQGARSEPNLNHFENPNNN